MHILQPLDSSSPDSVLTPSFRKIRFGDEPHMVTVSKYLRKAWAANPYGDTSPGTEGVGRFLREYSHADEAAQQQWPQNTETERLHSPWRNSVYYLWNHVFFDAMNFLKGVEVDVGDFRPPSHDVFGLKTGDDSGPTEALAVDKVWNTNVLLIPAYLAPGVSVHLSQRRRDSASDTTANDLGEFNGTNPYEVWFLEKGTEVRFTAFKELNGDLDGLAAVIAVGVAN